MLTPFQSFIRGDELTVECREYDALGRELPIVSMRAPVSAELRTALNEQVASLITAQETLIVTATADVAAGRPAPKRMHVDLIADEQDRKAEDARVAAEKAAKKEAKP